jgi:hypothetical protein
MICTEKKRITETRDALRTAPKAPAPSLPTEPPVENLEGLICWWCVHALPQKPCIHLPIKYDDKLKIFKTLGNFCSWQCAKAYALDMNTARSGEIQSLLSMMRLQALGRYYPLWPAPKRAILKCFGGTMSIEEFRTFGGAVEPPQLYYPYEKCYIPIIGGEVRGGRESVVHAPTNGGERLKAIENSSTETDTLRLKRNKPLVRATSKLENALGIKRKGKETPGE